MTAPHADAPLDASDARILAWYVNEFRRHVKYRAPVELIEALEQQFERWARLRGITKTIAEIYNEGRELGAGYKGD